MSEALSFGQAPHGVSAPAQGLYLQPCHQKVTWGEEIYHISIG